MDGIEVKIEENASEMNKSAHMMELFENDDVLPPVNEPEPIVEYSTSQSTTLSQHCDPLSTAEEEMRLIPEENFVNIPAVKVEFYEPETEVTTDSKLPETTPCSVLLDTNEIMKYYCPETCRFLSTNSPQCNREQMLWEIPCKIEVNPTSWSTLQRPSTSNSKSTSDEEDFTVSDSDDSSVASTQESYSDNYNDTTNNSKYGLRNPKFPCKYCTKLFKTKLSLKYHQKNHKKSLKNGKNNKKKKKATINNKSITISNKNTCKNTDKIVKMPPEGIEFQRRAAVVQCLRAGKSQAEIAKFLKYPRSTVHDIANRFYAAENSEEGTATPLRKKREASKSKRTKNVVKKARKMILKDPSLSLSQMAPKLNISLTTMRRIASEDLRDVFRNLVAQNLKIKHPNFIGPFKN